MTTDWCHWWKSQPCDCEDCKKGHKLGEFYSVGGGLEERRCLVCKKMVSYRRVRC